MTLESKDSIRHIIIFDLKHPKGSEQAAKFLADGERILTAIPGVRNFGAFEQVSPRNDYGYGFSMEFASDEEFQAYNTHPDHVSFIHERWLNEVERYQEIDFRLPGSGE